MSEELKPCPFCGGEADEHRDRGPTGELYVWVGCNDCDATSACVDERSMQPEESDAQSLWNTRAEASSAEPVADIAGYERGQRETVARIVAWLRVQQHGRTSDNYPGYYAKRIEAGEWDKTGDSHDQ